MDLYAVLGVDRSATETEIRRAYKTLVTKTHPDKGGDPVKFKAVQTAYDVLSDRSKRKLYDDTGKVQKTVDEEFVDSFAGGTFRDRMRDVDVSPASITDQIALRQSAEAQSHSAGFEAWLRSRGDGGTQLYTADTIAEQFGVVRSSYETVALPSGTAYVATCVSVGKPQSSVSVAAQDLPKELEWGEVLVLLKYAPINPADLYTVHMGGTYGTDKVPLPFVCGHDGVGVVAKVGPGVKALKERDVVLPFKTFMGTWRTSSVWKEKELLKVAGTEEDPIMPLEYLAMCREMCVAYRLLEDFGKLKPGDCVILNGANSTVGQCLLQLCRLLKLRAVAVIRRHSDSSFERISKALLSLGAVEVLPDEGSLKEKLDQLKFFARPKLALDGVGGDSGVRLVEALAEGGQVVFYGCMSGQAPSWPWTSWVFRDLKVVGFNLRRWMTANKSRVVPLLESLGKLVRAGMLTVNYTEYDFPGEFSEALDHGVDKGKNTKILLKMVSPDGFLDGGSKK